MKAMENGKSCGACHNGSDAFSVASSFDCAKCHAGDIVFRDETIGTITFPHSVHIENLGGCSDCHPDLYRAKRSKGKTTMKAMEKGKSCGACHDGETAFSVADSSECAKCHAGDIVFKNKNIGKITFPHSVHIEMLDGCDSCHPDLFKAKQGANEATMEDMENGESCGACHDGDSAFGVTDFGTCNNCHAGGDIVFKNKGVGDVTFPHSVHIEMFEGCDSCHPDLFKAEQGTNKATMAAMENGESCGACHDGDSAFGVAEDCESCHEGGIKVDKITIHTEKVGNVVFSHAVHGTNCDGCHPKLFVKKNNSNHTNMKVMEQGKSCGACHNGKKAFNVTGDCVKCHAGDIIFKEEDAGNVTFPHSVHIEMLGGCDACHPDLFKAERGANKATMEDMENGESCGACHDGSEAFSVAEDCESCHEM
jgi:c(7)-type cytochrome triheme protein